MTVGDLLPGWRELAPVIIGAVFVSLIIYTWMCLYDMRARDINIDTEPPDDMPMPPRMPPKQERIMPKVPDVIMLQFEDGYLLRYIENVWVPSAYWDIMFKNHGKCISKFRVYIKKTS